jgi:hypothetical protein
VNLNATKSCAGCSGGVACSACPVAGVSLGPVAFPNIARGRTQTGNIRNSMIHGVGQTMFVSSLPRQNVASSSRFSPVRGVGGDSIPSIVASGAESLAGAIFSPLPTAISLLFSGGLPSSSDNSAGSTSTSSGGVISSAAQGFGTGVGKTFGSGLLLIGLAVAGYIYFKKKI